MKKFYAGLLAFVCCLTILSGSVQAAPRPTNINYCIDFDRNNDGIDDQVCIDTSGNMWVTYDLYDWTDISGGHHWLSVVSADYDGDGRKDDLAAVRNDNYVFYSTSPGSWSQSGLNQIQPYTLCSGNFNASGGDGLAGVNLNGYAIYTTYAPYNWTRSGSNNFPTSGASLTSFRVPGTSRDGLAGANLNTNMIYTSDVLTDWTRSGANTFTTLNRGAQVTSGDFDGDGNNDDVAAINNNGYVVFIYDIHLSSSSSNWSLSGANLFNSNTALASGDLNADGKDDLAGVNNNGYIIYRQAPLEGIWTLISSSPTFTHLTIGDFNECDTGAEIAGVVTSGALKYSNLSGWVDDIACCGDGITAPTEMCEDSSQCSGYACVDCTCVGTCGDGIINGPEECEQDYDCGDNQMCDEFCGCVDTVCGNNIKEGTEECEANSDCSNDQECFTDYCKCASVYGTITDCVGSPASSVEMKLNQISCGTIGEVDTAVTNSDGDYWFAASLITDTIYQITETVLNDDADFQSTQPEYFNYPTERINPYNFTEKNCP